MYRFFVDPAQIGEKEIFIEGADVNHIRNVLRMRPGEEIRLCTGEDNRDFRCRIREIEPERISCEILWVEYQGTELPSEIILFQGLPKSDKMEMIIQKAVELGAKEIVPVAMKRSVLKLSGGKAENRVRRWNAISESAAKQSKRMIIPKVVDIISFQEALKMAGNLDLILLPYERAGGMEATRKIIESVKPGQSIGIFIGPEGGFEETEVESAINAGAKVITLGRRILRTETAGLAILSALMLRLDTDPKEDPDVL